MKPSVLSLVLVAAVTSPLLAPPVLADVASDDTARLRAYEDQAIVIKEPASGSYELKRGGRTIDDMQLASASNDPDLVRQVQGARSVSHAYKLSMGLLGIPLGLLVAVDNFFGQRTKAQKVGGFTLPPSIVAPFPESNPLSFVLAVGGAALALYGAWQLGELAAEAAGTFHPSYLQPEQAKAAVKAYDRQLALDLGLSPTEVAEATPEATPSPPPSLIPPGFPAGEDGSGCWAVRQAVPFVQAHLSADYRPYLVWTTDIHDFETGVIHDGRWHVDFAGSDPHDDLDVTVPLHGTLDWTRARPFFTRYRAGTDLLSKVKVDSPRALFLLKAPFVERQVGWLQPGSMVILFPFWGRLKGPLWTLYLGSERTPPQIGIDAEFGTLVDLKRYQM